MRTNYGTKWSFQAILLFLFVVLNYPNEKILVVEDDADIINMVELVLNEAGYAVIKITKQIPIIEVHGFKIVARMPL